MELFDYRISYHQTADVIQSYLHDNFISLMKQSVDTKKKANNICMLISSPINQSSRQEYLKQKDLRPQFIEKAQLQKTAPFIRLCELI